MSTATFALGDVLLMAVPVSSGQTMEPRPVMVVKDAPAGETEIAVVPLSSDPLLQSNTVMIALGTYESARMGLVTTAYLNARPPINVQRKWIVAHIGVAPRRLLQEFLELYDQPVYGDNNFVSSKYF